MSAAMRSKAMKPFPYQLTGARFLAERKRALLADDMGLGKSAQAIMACDELGARNVLVICPASVRENWRREFAKWSGIKPIVQSYNNANAINTDPPPSDSWDVLVLDESHYLKSKDAKRTRAIFGPKCDGVGGLVERAKHVFLLTGTPAPNHAAELWPMLRACAPETIPSATGRPMSYWTYVSCYCRTRDNGFGLQIVGGKNLDKLKAAIAPFMLRRKKDEVLRDLPPIRFDTLAVEGADATWELPQAEKEWADKLRAALAEKGVDALREFAPHVAQLRRLTGLAKVKSCVEWIKDWLPCGDPLVIFAHHRDVIAALEKGCREAAETVPVWITGSTRAVQRQEAIDRFQAGKAQVFIGQIQAAGTGITLTAASDVLFVEQDWTPAGNSQAAMRIHRIGQRNACMVRVACLAGSIDEDIQRALLRKMDDLKVLFDDEKISACA